MTSDPKAIVPAGSEFLLYAVPDGTVKVRVLFKDETTWLTQKALAELFGVKVLAITKPPNNFFESGELDRSATVSKMEIVQSDGDPCALTKTGLVPCDILELIKKEDPAHFDGMAKRVGLTEVAT